MRPRFHPSPPPRRLPAPSPPTPPLSPPDPPPPRLAPWGLSAVEESGSQRLQVITPDGMRATCERLTLHVNGVPPVAATVEGKQVHLHYGAPDGGDTLRA